jgi:hypothetical protein
MLNNTKVLWTVIVLLLVLNVSVIATVWISRPEIVHTNPWRGTGKPHKGRLLKQELQLSATQQVFIDSLRTEHQQAMKQQMAEVAQLRRMLMADLENDEEFSEAEELLRQINDKQANIELLTFRHFKTMLALLDEDQQKAFVKMMRRGMRRQHKGQGQRGRL